MKTICLHITLFDSFDLHITELFVEERKKEEEKIKYSMKYEVRCGAGPFRSRALGHGLLGLCLNPPLVYLLSHDIFLCVESMMSTNYKSTSEWRGFEPRWFYQSGFDFSKTRLLILNH